MASQERVASYINLVSSEAIAAAAVQSAGIDMPVSEARKSLRGGTRPKTVLMTITARSDDPAVAQRLANGAAVALVEYVKSLETPSAGGEPLAKLTVVSPASASSQAVSPKIWRNLGFGLVAGAVIGLALLVARVRFGNKIGDESDLKGLFDEPVLASVPADDNLGSTGVLDFSHGATPAAEAYRRLRTNLEYVGVDNRLRTLLVTSSNAREGKTTTALNLAAAVAEQGQRVVLVEGDLRKPTVGKRLPTVLGDVGVTTLLRGDISLEDVAQQSGIAGLDILPAGPGAPNPAELLGSDKAGAMFRDLQQRYDFVVVDSPPVLEVADATVLARHVDGVLFVVGANEATRSDLQAVRSQLDIAGVKVVGITLNRAASRPGAYYSYTTPSGVVGDKSGLSTTTAAAK
ncbi:polysaccharide biosynthesis tyrosine autokinase [Gordonia alkanivorans]|uniref:polysaccharide biosynthesis tyrosine autokinase n=1 Tax=Gordonia alkanivorans TaxID=84096 RepID=UPI0024B82A29|nr:polysaccharide biosynthesis tyrosine autokinase [Gordonia alkanivorans]MDJ0029767.1 polysaccharide biosynthesis tyrosine autokinase [Gordonia alkanivorans]